MFLKINEQKIVSLESEKMRCFWFPATPVAELMFIFCKTEKPLSRDCKFDSFRWFLQTTLETYLLFVGFYFWR